MAFALTKFKADGIRHTGPTRSHGEQIAIFNITAAATDIDLDISDATGTFWTAALANTTYGGLASTAQALFFSTATSGTIPAAVASLLAIESETLLTRIQVASGATGTQYTVAVNTNFPDLGFVSGSAPTSMVLVLRWLLADGQEPVIADLGAAIS